MRRPPPHHPSNDRRLSFPPVALAVAMAMAMVVAVAVTGSVVVCDHPGCLGAALIWKNHRPPRQRGRSGRLRQSWVDGGTPGDSKRLWATLSSALDGYKQTRAVLGRLSRSLCVIRRRERFCAAIKGRTALGGPKQLQTTPNDSGRLRATMGNLCNSNNLGWLTATIAEFASRLLTPL